MKLLISLIIMCLFSLQALGKSPETAKPKNGDHEHKMDHKGHDHKDSQAEVKRVSPEKIIVKVKGMVCAFCAQGIQKNFSKRQEVKDVSVDLDSMEVTIQLVKGKVLPEKVIESIVSGAGFKYMGLK